MDTVEGVALEKYCRPALPQCQNGCLREPQTAEGVEHYMHPHALAGFFAQKFKKIEIVQVVQKNISLEIDRLARVFYGGKHRLPGPKGARIKFVRHKFFCGHKYFLAVTRKFRDPG